MKSDFMIALTQLASERNLPKEVILSAVEKALVSVFKKEGAADPRNVTVKIVPQTGEVRVYTHKVVVDEVADSNCEISIAEARRLKQGIVIGDSISIESTPPNAKRVAAQTVKQVVLQRLKEAEHELIIDEFADKEKGLVAGIIKRVESRQAMVDLGKAEALFPISEQVETENYRVGQRYKFYLLGVTPSAKGPQLIVSRSHPDFLRRLFELEVPEIHSGTVELKAIVREAGYRSKVAVAPQQEGLDSIGCCVGLRGVRIQNITKELGDEKIDIVQWNASHVVFISNALSPAPVVKVVLDEVAKSATAVVPDKQLSLAIGKEGQNVRLAAKLTGWHIDIKSVSLADMEEKLKPVTEPEVVEEEPVSSRSIESIESIESVGAVVQQEEETPVIPELMEEKPSPVAEEPAKKEIEESTKKSVPMKTMEVAPPIPGAKPVSLPPAPEVEGVSSEDVLSILDRSLGKVSQQQNDGKPKLRFAEDLLRNRGGGGDAKGKKKKKRVIHAAEEDD